jgi:cytidine deaminase
MWNSINLDGDMSTSPRAISSDTLNKLRLAAAAASEKAYCPYSKFAVGAAVLSDNGSVFTGCNVENASYGLTICAERSAVFQAVAAGCRRIVAVVIFTPTQQPSAPCGACRQVIYEFGPEATVYSFCSADAVIQSPISDLLTLAFGPNDISS